MNMPGNPSCIPCTRPTNSAPRGTLQASPAPALSSHVYLGLPSLESQEVSASAAAAVPAVAHVCPCQRRRLAVFALALVAVYLLARS